MFLHTGAGHTCYLHISSQHILVLGLHQCGLHCESGQIMRNPDCCMNRDCRWSRAFCNTQHFASLGCLDLNSDVMSFDAGFIAAFPVSVQNGSLHQKDTVHDNDFEPYLTGQSNQVGNISECEPVSVCCAALTNDPYPVSLCRITAISP